MSDSDESRVTYTEVSSPFEGLLDIGSPRADDHEYLELPWMPEDPYVEATLQAPPSLDYVPGPEEPEQAPPSPDYILGPEHADDEIVAEDQPYVEDTSPTAQSPDYVPEFDPEADSEEDDDEDPEEDHVDYPADGGDDKDDEDESSEEDDDDDVDRETGLRNDGGGGAPQAPLPTLSSLLLYKLLDAGHIAEGQTEAFEGLPDFSHNISTSPSRHAHPYVFTTSPVTSPPLPSIPSPITTVLPPLPSIIHPVLEDRPEVTLPPRKRLGIALGPAYEVEESSSAATARPAGGLRADYGFVATIDREIRLDSGREVGMAKIRDEIYTRLDDEQSQRQLLAGRLNMLFRDRRAHAYTRHLMETKARLSREAWRRQAVTSEMLKADHMRSAEIRELRTADRTRQQQLIQTLTGQQGPAGGPAQPEITEGWLGSSF
ncbi:hypothetical protein Tco_0030909 [Tanacetum coccineum]